MVRLGTNRTIHHDFLGSIRNSWEQSEIKCIPDRKVVVAGSGNYNIVKRCDTVDGVSHIKNQMIWTDRSGGVEILGEPGMKSFKAVKACCLGVLKIVLSPPRLVIVCRRSCRRMPTGAVPADKFARWRI